MRQKYVDIKFTRSTLETIDYVNGIIRDYNAQGYKLTVRQIYYQLVARNIIANTYQNYKRIASIINDGKMAGIVDWDAIEDRTREFIIRNHWRNGGSILRACADQYFEDMWQNQHTRVAVIIEKEALVGVLTDLCERYDVPILAARGYPSGTVLREFAKTVVNPALVHGQNYHSLHLGDHDPSGLDMTRDLTEKFGIFCDGDPNIALTRLALNMDQIEELNPPKNPAKSTDSRFEKYAQEFGTSSWELDALQPSFLNELVESNITGFIDQERWDEMDERIQWTRKEIRKVADDFDQR